MLITVAVAVWELAAVADYFHHRQERIEKTGIGESLIHMALILQGSIVAAMAIFAPPAPWMGAFIVGNVLVHALISVLDITVAMARRRISNREHALHYVLNICPVVIAADYVAEYPIPSPTYVTILFTSIAVTVVLPYGEEFLRCLAYERNEK